MEKSEIASRLQLQHWCQRRFYLSRDERIQEETIAEHYVAFAHLARQLKSLTDARKFGDSNPALDETIKFMAAKIREGHLMEFGLELQWPKIVS